MVLQLSTTRERPRSLGQAIVETIDKTKEAGKRRLYLFSKQAANESQKWGNRAVKVAGRFKLLPWANKLHGPSETSELPDEVPIKNIETLADIQIRNITSLKSPEDLYNYTILYLNHFNPSDSQNALDVQARTIPIEETAEIASTSRVARSRLSTKEIGNLIHEVTYYLKTDNPTMVIQGKQMLLESLTTFLRTTPDVKMRTEFIKLLFEHAGVEKPLANEADDARHRPNALALILEDLFNGSNLVKILKVQKHGPQYIKTLIRFLATITDPATLAVDLLMAGQPIKDPQKLEEEKTLISSIDSLRRSIKTRLEMFSPELPLTFPISPRTTRGLYDMRDSFTDTLQNHISLPESLS